MTVVDQQSKEFIALFDFDGTLTYRDSLMPFIRMAMGWPKFIWGLFVLSPILLAYVMKLVKNSYAKQAVLTYYFAGLEQEDFQAWADKFAKQRIPAMLRPEAILRLRWHQQQGHKIMIVSASMESYLQPWAKTLQCGAKVAGSKIEIIDGHLSGRLDGKNCYGPEKIVRLEEQLGNLKDYYIYAYGDSKGDRELLAAADEKFFKCFPDAGDKDK